MQKFYDSWKEFCSRSFPRGYGCEEVYGIDLVSLDTFTAGCIDTFVRNRGQLDQERLDILRVCETELEIVVNNLTGDAKDYFKNLHELSKETLAFLDGYLYQ